MGSILKNLLIAISFACYLAGPAFAQDGGSLTFQLPVESESGAKREVPVTLKWGNVATTAEQIEFVEQVELARDKIVAEHGSKVPKDLAKDIVIVVNDQNPAAIKEAVELTKEVINRGFQPHLLNANHEPLQELIDLALRNRVDAAEVRAELRDQVKGTSWEAALFGKIGMHGVEPSSVEKSTAWIMSGFRTLTLIPMLAVGLQAPMAAAAFAGYGITALMVGRTLYRSRYIKAFDRLYSFADKNGKRRIPKAFEQIVRQGADLVFFELLGYLKGINTGQAASQGQILTLWGLQATLSNMFQTVRNNTFSVPPDHPDYEKTRRRSAIANLNWWVLMAPWPVLELFGYAPKLFSLVYVDFTVAHAGMILTNLASMFVLKKAVDWYSRVLDAEYNAARALRTRVRRIFRTRRRDLTEKCALLKVRFDPKSIADHISTDVATPAAP